MLVNHILVCMKPYFGVFETIYHFWTMEAMIDACSAIRLYFHFIEYKSLIIKSTIKCKKKCISSFIKYLCNQLTHPFYSLPIK